jgi:LPS sulfotransferase NodH
MTVWEDQFSERHDFGAGAPVASRYAICSTQRSGSHFLGHLLRATGQLGYPLEYFNPQNLDRWRQRAREAGAASLVGFLESIRTSPNGCFGIKVHFLQLEVLAQEMRFEDFLRDYKLIHIRRRDVLGQAISYAKASQTGAFISEVEAAREPRYDRSLIDDCLDRILWQNACWLRLFSSTGVAYEAIDYEDLAADPVTALERIGRFVGVDAVGPGRSDSPRPARQSDSTNEAWRARYLAESRDRAWRPSDFDVGGAARRGWAARVSRRLARLLGGRP